MGKNASMTLEQRNRALGMIEAGMTCAAVARRIGCSRSTISRLRSRLLDTGSLKDRPRTGRPRKTTANEDRYITLTSRRNRFYSGQKLANHLHTTTRTRISAQTARRRLHSAQLKGRRPCIGVPLTRRHRHERLNWAQIHQRWVQQQWHSVLFTDESRFTVQFADGRLRVWRRKGERYDAPNVIQRDRYGGGSVMVWGGIARNSKTELITVPGTLTAARYCDEIVVPVIVPYMRQRNGVILQQDNARPHTAILTRTVFDQHGIDTLDWPAKSPDLSPIEHMWDILGRRVRERDDVIDVRSLEQALHEEWGNITFPEVNKLIGSMRRRCVAVVASNGGHTKY